MTESASVDAVEIGGDEKAEAMRETMTDSEAEDDSSDEDTSDDSSDEYVVR